MRVRAYLELMRPPNVATAVADVLAGYTVAGLGHPLSLRWLLAASACLYAGGVVLNDFFDRALDAVERPERPIPSGRVRPAAAAGLGAVLLAGGVAAASRASPQAAIVAATIAALVVCYDAWGKRLPLVGPVNMGACRGLNLMLGVAAAPTALPVHWPLAGLPFTYIWAVTTLSRGEVHGGRRASAALALAAITAVVMVVGVMAAQSGSRAVPALVLTGILGWRVLPAYWRAFQDGQPGVIRQAIKAGVLSLVILDAVVAAIYAGTLYALLILAVAVFAVALARLFAVT